MPRALAQPGIGTVVFEDPGDAEDRVTAKRQGLHAIRIPDDYDSDFRYDREPVGALQGLAAHSGACLEGVAERRFSLAGHSDQPGRTRPDS